MLNRKMSRRFREYIYEKIAFKCQLNMVELVESSSKYAVSGGRIREKMNYIIVQAGGKDMCLLIIVDYGTVYV